MYGKMYVPRTARARKPKLLMHTFVNNYISKV